MSNTPAILYLRVSSERQVREGSGLDSQEQRCRAFAAMKGYEVVAVFRDEGVSGAVLNRPGIQEALTFLKGQPRIQKPVMIVDDISRIARSVETHIALRAAIEACGSRLESPSFSFENNAMGEFMEVIFAGIAQYGRSGNREQVLNRQRARLELGYWTFPVPPGYRYQKHPVHKKIAMLDGKRAKIVKQALEGFACGRFLSKRALAEFLKEQGYFSDVGKKRFTSNWEMTAATMLNDLPFYAGYVEYPKWKIERRKGMHKPLIDEMTFRLCRDRLNGNLAPVLRRDTSDVFLLRNFVRCAECRRPLTASYVKRVYPRYHCYNKGGCPQYGHTIHMDRLHEEFTALLRKMEITEEAMELVDDVVTVAWKQRHHEGDAHAREAERRAASLDSEISALLRRAARADDFVAAAYEKEAGLLSQERECLELEAAQGLQDFSDFPAAWEFVRESVRNPLGTWEKGDAEHKRKVMHAVFTTAPTYLRRRGFGTSHLTLPYRVPREIVRSKSRMVEVTIKSWYEFFLEVQRMVNI